MATKTETLTMPLMHVYHLTADPANDTGYTIEEVTKLMEEHGSDYKIEVTVTHPIPDPQPEEIEVSSEVVEENSATSQEVTE
jgi:hypothetical protein